MTDAPVYLTLKAVAVPNGSAGVSSQRTAGLFVSTRQLAARWTCSARHVRALCASGELRAMRLGRDWRIDVSDVLAYEQRQSNAPTPAAPTTQDQPVRATTVDGYALPADYEPVFPALWEQQ